MEKHVDRNMKKMFKYVFGRHVCSVYSAPYQACVDQVNRILASKYYANGQ